MSYRTHARHRAVEEVRVRCHPCPNFFYCAITSVRSLGGTRRTFRRAFPFPFDARIPCLSPHASLSLSRSFPSPVAAPFPLLFPHPFPNASAATRDLISDARASPQRSSARLNTSDAALSPGLPQASKKAKTAAQDLAAAIANSTSPHRKLASSLLATITSPHTVGNRHLAELSDFITPTITEALIAKGARTRCAN